MLQLERLLGHKISLRRLRELESRTQLVPVEGDLRIEIKTVEGVQVSSHGPVVLVPDVLAAGAPGVLLDEMLDPRLGIQAVFGNVSTAKDAQVATEAVVYANRSTVRPVLADAPC